MSAGTRPTVNRLRTLTLPLTLLVGLLVAVVPPAAAGSPDGVIVLPGASSAEGIARGDGTTFYAGDLFGGDIFRGDLEEREATLFIEVPDGRMALGMYADRRHDLLFVAGGFTGQAYVYDLRSGATVATYQLTDPETSVVNDVTVTREGAWFTDSFQARLYFVPVSRNGELGEFRTLALKGPAADTSGEFNLNGIVAARHGRTLIVAHSTNGTLYTVDPGTGGSAAITGVSLPDVDGIVREGRTLWAVQGANQVTEVRLSRDLTAKSVRDVITDDAFQTPSTAIHFDGGLAVVNAKFDTGVPPTADEYEVVLVDD